MIRNKWKIELWFQKFSYFIHKINTEFVPERITFNKYNLIKGQTLPNEIVYISYFINQPDQIIEQHTVKSDRNGIFTDNVPKPGPSDSFENDELSYSVDSQSKIDIEYLLQEIIDEAAPVLEILDSTTVENYFDAFLKSINAVSKFAKENAINAINQIKSNLKLQNHSYQIEIFNNQSTLALSPEFSNLKNAMIEAHQDLTTETYDDFLTNDFLTQYLVYKEKQDSYLKKDISLQNKSNYFIKLINKGLIKERKSNSQYFDIANSIKPSTHKKDSLEQSDNIDQFRQAAVGVSLYLYDKNDPYFKFIRSIANENSRRKEITVDDVIQSQKRIDKFMKAENLISNNELYYRTTIEDTFHFTLFTAISDLVDELVKTTSYIIQKATDHDILVTLQIRNSLKKELKVWDEKYEQKFNHFENLITGYTRNTNLKELIKKTIQIKPQLTASIEEELNSTLKKYNIDTFYSRQNNQNISNNPNDFRDILMIQSISKFYESRFKDNDKFYL